jgi:lipopolysaccharide export system protein LptA
MLRLLLILISAFTLSSNSAVKTPVVVYSNKVEFNKLLGEIKYEGAVRVDFDEYSVVTSKMNVTTQKKDGVTKILYVSFPEKANIVKNDNSEVIMVNNAMYIAETGLISASGDIKIEKEGQFFATQFIEIKLGDSRGITQLWQ